MKIRCMKFYAALCMFVLLAGIGTAASAAAPVPPPLSSLTVPEPDNLYDFVKSKKWAIMLGKIFFWDMQVGSDGVQACATCHFNAGADIRIKNQLSPGVLAHPADTTFGFGNIPGNPPPLNCNRGPTGTNYILQTSDFPLNRPFGPSQCETNDVVSSQGVLGHDFKYLSKKGDVDVGVQFGVDPDGFGSGASAVRRVEPRNTPTMINAVFFLRSFWDARAMPNFNGVNPDGSVDQNAFVAEWKYGFLYKKKVVIPDSSLASQAVGPPLSHFEMSWLGRRFPDVGRKMLRLKPLGKQKVSKHDSVLGPYAKGTKPGLKNKYTYKYLIRKAFKDKWWKGSPFGRVCVPKVGKTGSPYVTNEVHCKKNYDAFTQMEYNFSLFWGLAIQLYEATLISDKTPFDICAEAGGGDAAVLDCLGDQNPAWKTGMEAFLTQGDPGTKVGGTCFGCHRGAMFSGASISDIEDKGGLNGKLPLLTPPNPANSVGVYDLGFANVGVTDTDFDHGIGGTFGDGTTPLSFSAGLTTPEFPGPVIPICDENAPGGPLGEAACNALGVDLVMSPGAMKTPGLRNRKFMGPHFHSGDTNNIAGTIGFYAGQGNGNPSKDPRLEQIVMPFGGPLAGPGAAARAGIQALLEGALTDERVEYQKAPFDHPELCVPNGHHPDGKTDFRLVEVVGKYGSPNPLVTFDDMLNGTTAGKANNLEKSCPKYMLPQKGKKKSGFDFDFDF